MAREMFFRSHFLTERFSQETLDILRLDAINRSHLQLPLCYSIKGGGHACNKISPKVIVPSPGAG